MAELVITVLESELAILTSSATSKGLADAASLVSLLASEHAVNVARVVTPIHQRLEELDARSAEAARLLIGQSADLQALRQDIAAIKARNP